MGQEREPFTSDGYTAPQAPLIAIRFVAHRFRRLIRLGQEQRVSDQPGIWVLPPLSFLLL